MNENIKLLRELDRSININVLYNAERVILKSDKEQLNRVFFNFIEKI